jgi:hypothetical protein
MKRLSPTDIITAAHIEAIQRDIARFDPSEADTDKQADLVRPRPRPKPRPELSPGFRRVHIESNGTEREPLDGEPYMSVERADNKATENGRFETTIMPYSFGVPRYGGPWEITEISPNGKWITWIRLAKGVQS